MKQGHTEPAWIKAKRATAIILLLFNGGSACFGGWMLVSDPSGARLGMPLDWLQYSPFDTYLFLGMLLIVFLGLSSIMVAVLAFARVRNYPLMILYQGAVVVIWIIIQMLMIRMYHPLHLLYGSIGAVMIILGLMLQGRIKELI